ncbi:sugar phosphate isomerase/epimerase [bacterium]|nr:sugar phosphate isomerase/epimerase [bacterium]
MKLGLSTHSFATAIHGGRMNLAKIIDFAAQNGFEGMEIVNSREAWRKDIGDDIKMNVMRLRERKLRYYCYSVCEDIAAPDETARWRSMNKVREAILLSSVTNVPLLCIHGIGSKDETADWDESMKTIVASLKDCLELAERKRVTLAFANSGQVLNGAKRMNDVLDAVGSEFLRACIDVASLLLVEEEPADVLRELQGSIANVYFTDARSSDTYIGNKWTTVRGRQLTPCAVGEGIVPQREVLYTLKRLDYAGYVTVLYQGEEEPAVGIERSATYLKTILREVRNL